MRHLTAEQRKELYTALLDEKRDLEKHFADNHNYGLEMAQRDSTGELFAYDNHPADLGSEQFEREQELAAYNEAERHLLDVDAALALFDKGEYGTCAVCGAAIPFERLKALPTTAFCIEHSPVRHVPDDRPSEKQILFPRFGRTSLDGLSEQNRLQDFESFIASEIYVQYDSVIRRTAYNSCLDRNAGERLLEPDYLREEDP